jgi:hypothetical protein
MDAFISEAIAGATVWGLTSDRRDLRSVFGFSGEDGSTPLRLSVEPKGKAATRLLAGLPPLLRC